MVSETQMHSKSFSELNDGSSNFSMPSLRARHTLLNSLQTERDQSSIWKDSYSTCPLGSFSQFENVPLVVPTRSGESRR